MSRRRQKNNLLPKMLVIAIVVNAILLPILAQMGVFKNRGGHHLDQVRLITLPPEKKPPTPKRTPPKKRVAKAKPRPATRAASRPAPARPNPNQPKVVASSGSAGGPAINNNGTAAAGQLPVPPPAAPPPPVVPTPPPPTPAPPPPVTAPPPAPPPSPAPAPPPHMPVVVEAEPLSQPQPQIPDDLSYDDIHGDFQALFSVQASGDATVKMVASTGDPRLDALALDAARHWTFRPATVDGKPVDSYRRLSIQFYAT